MKKVFYASLLLLHSTCLSAQLTWQRSYDLVPGGTPRNSDIGLQIYPSGDGYLLLTGTLFDNNTTNGFGLYRIDSHGDVLLKKAFLNTENPMRAFGQDMMLELPSGDIVITGDQHTNDFPDISRVFLMKLTSEGDSIWMHTYNNEWLDFPDAVVQTPDGGFLIEGSGGSDIQDIFLLKTDSNGIEQWNKRLGMTDQFRYSVYGNLIALNDGGFAVGYIAANYISNNEYTQVVRLDELGNILWHKEFYEQQFCSPTLRKDNDGNLILITCVDTLIAPWFNPYVMFVTKIDTAGNILWEFAFDSDVIRSHGDIEVAANGDILVAGLRRDEDTLYDKAWIARVSGEGELLWEKTYSVEPTNPFSIFWLYDIEACSDAGMIVSGLIVEEPVSGVYDGNAWVMKLDENGCFLSNECQENNIIVSAANLPILPQQEIGLYPNPASGTLHIALPEGIPELEVAVYDLAGKLMQRQMVSNETALPLNQQGVFILAFFREGVWVATKKIVNIPR
ncbi:MAG: T9SS type A sorting domain-containing protein [Saprospiraceae bacterium]|nr:T9SS type A sorting domain-containing protein [Saprospiraceae bacterium]